MTIVIVVVAAVVVVRTGSLFNGRHLRTGLQKRNIIHSNDYALVIVGGWCWLIICALQRKRINGPEY